MQMANVPSCNLGLRSSASASAASPIVWQPPTQQTGAGHVRGTAWHTASGQNSMGISILCPPHPWASPAEHEGMRVWSFVRCLIDSVGQARGTAPSPGLLPPAASWSSCVACDSRSAARVGGDQFQRSRHVKICERCPVNSFKPHLRHKNTTLPRIMHVPTVNTST